MRNARPVEGFWRRLRWAADGILIAILLAVPWLRIGGEPLVWLDIPGRKFHVAGVVIFPQELYFLWLILALLALSLFFFTALFGRLWCGWACPQTVFTDVFAAVERRIEGWGRGGRPAHVAPWRRGIVIVVWLAMSALIGFHLVAYFVPAPELWQRVASGTLSPAAGGFLLAATALSFLDFVVIRQTFCKYLCPYARFQSVLFDRDTLVVAYDTQRGEPRGKRHAGASAHGDCVDCGLCVAVCPSGIDIRNGMQLECVACTQCIDACDGVMARLGRAPSLIGYASLVGLEGARPARWLRPRVLVYASLLAVVVSAFGAALASRQPLDLQVAHNPQSLSVPAADGRIGNAFLLHVQNRDRREHRYRLSLEDGTGYELVVGMNPVTVPALDMVELRVFVLAEAGKATPGQRLRFVLEQVDDPRRRLSREATFMTHAATGGTFGGGR